MSFVFFIGLCWGSFLNVWIYRIPRKESIAHGRSHCPSCQHSLGPMDLVPVLSFIFLGGKCRYCKAGISPQYPFIELLVGALFLLSYLRFVQPQELASPYILIKTFFFITVNVVIAKIDWDLSIIPNSISYPSIVAGMVFALYNREYEGVIGLAPNPDIFSSLLGGGLYFGLFLSLFVVSKGGMGMGDVKWALFLGLSLGWFYGFIAIFMASLLSVFFSYFVLYMFKDKVERLEGVSGEEDDEIPASKKVWGVSITDGKPAVVFGPFLAIGFLTAWFFGSSISLFLGLL